MPNRLKGIKTMTEQLENTVDVADLGKKAVGLWRQGDKGDAVATYCLWLAHHQITFQCDVVDRKGSIEETLTFDLNEMNRHSAAYRDLHNENGSRNIKAIAARTIEVASRIFGLAEPTVAQKQRIDRALEMVAGFERLNLPLEAITLSNRNELCVPYVVMNAEPDPEKASTNEVNAYERLRDSTTALDGKDGQSLAALKRRLSPPKAKGADQNGKANRVVEFVNSVKFIGAVMNARNDETGENKAADDIPAFSGAIKGDLWNLYQSLGAYFEADPMSEEGEESDDEKGTGTNG